MSWNVFFKELTVECSGKRILSPTSVIHFCLKSGSGKVKSIFLECELH